MMAYLFLVACLINWFTFGLFALGSSDPRASDDLRGVYAVVSVVSLLLALAACVAHGLGWLV